MTLRELVFICLDELKLSGSDDSFFNENHIRFLLNKWRARLLKQEYDTNKAKQVSESAYQTICLDLEDSNPLGLDINCGEFYRRSIKKIPATLKAVGDPIISAGDIFSNDRIVYVSRQRMRFVGYNKWLKNIIYAALGDDSKLYLSSNNSQFQYLEQVQFTGVFEDAEKAMELSCNKDSSTCNPLDQEYPFETYLVPVLVYNVVKELLGAKYQPVDSINDSQDNLATLAQFLRQNMKSDLLKRLES
jgi:hypothetical protein